MRKFIALHVFNNTFKSLFTLGLLLLTFLSCKKGETKITPMVSISDSLAFKIDSVQLKIDSVYYDKKNAYFKISIQNNKGEKYYFPVDFDYSFQFNDRIQQIGTDFNFSYFYTQFLDENNHLILGHLYEPNLVTSFREKFDSLKIIDSIFQKKYGRHPNNESMERVLWGIKYHSVKKNGFFLKEKEEKKLTIRSHLGFDIRAYASDITSFSSIDLKKIAYAQLILHIDSSQIKRDLLLPKDIDSLYQNSIKIFHGTIYSNKVPLKFEY